MKGKIEKRLAYMIEEAPLPTAAELYEESISKMTQMDHITEQVEKEKKSGKNARRHIQATAAICVFFVLFLSGYYYEFERLDSRLILDVNPSIEAGINRRMNVLYLKGLNTDGEQLVEKIKQSGGNLEEILDQLLDCMILDGYFEQNQKTVLISVENRKNSRTQTLLQRVEREITAYLGQKNKTGRLCLQQISEDNTSSGQLKQRYGISSGKAQLIQKIIKRDQRFDPAVLATMDVDDLWDLLEDPEDGYEDYQEQKLKSTNQGSSDNIKENFSDQTEKKEQNTVQEYDIQDEKKNGDQDFYNDEEEHNDSEDKEHSQHNKFDDKHNWEHKQEYEEDQDLEEWDEEPEQDKDNIYEESDENNDDEEEDSDENDDD